MKLINQGLNEIVNLSTPIGGCIIKHSGKQDGWLKHYKLLTLTKLS